MNRRVEEAAGLPNAPTMLPFFSGAAAPFFDPSARGTLTGLDLSTTPAQVIRSIYEGIAFLIRANLEVMEASCAPGARTLRIFGGGSRSDAWCRIIADTVQRPVSALATAESASVGAAILAGTAGGVFADPEDAFRRLVVRTSYDPRPESPSAVRRGVRAVPFPRRPPARNVATDAAKSRAQEVPMRGTLQGGVCARRHLPGTGHRAGRLSRTTPGPTRASTIRCTRGASASTTATTKLALVCMDLAIYPKAEVRAVREAVVPSHGHSGRDTS